jgi:hypothetical protein
LAIKWDLLPFDLLRAKIALHELPDGLAEHVLLRTEDGPGPDVHHGRALHI